MKAEASLASAFVGVGRIAPDEERLVLLKLVVQFCFTYDVSRGFLYICSYFKHQSLYFLIHYVSDIHNEKGHDYFYFNS